MIGKYRSVKVRLTPRQARFIMDALDVYEDGIDIARNETADDNGFESMKDLLEVSAGYSDDQTIIEAIRRKMNHVLGN